jgi:hypothetical protein
LFFWSPYNSSYYVAFHFCYNIFSMDNLQLFTLSSWSVRFIFNPLYLPSNVNYIVLNNFKLGKVENSSKLAYSLN